MRDIIVAIFGKCSLPRLLKYTPPQIIATILYDSSIPHFRDEEPDLRNVM